MTLKFNSVLKGLQIIFLMVILLIPLIPSIPLMVISLIPKHVKRFYILTLKADEINNNMLQLELKKFKSSDIEIFTAAF